MMPGHQISGTSAPFMRDDIAAAISRSEGFLSGPVFLDTGSKTSLRSKRNIICPAIGRGCSTGWR